MIMINNDLVISITSKWRTNSSAKDRTS